MNAEAWTSPLIQRSKVFGLTYIPQISFTPTLSRTLTFYSMVYVLSVAKLQEHYYRINSKRYYFTHKDRLHRTRANPSMCWAGINKSPESSLSLCWVQLILCKDNANERNESLLSDCRVQLILCKDNANKRDSKRNACLLIRKMCEDKQK